MEEQLAKWCQLIRKDKIRHINRSLISNVWYKTLSIDDEFVFELIQKGETVIVEIGNSFYKLISNLENERVIVEKVNFYLE